MNRLINPPLSPIEYAGSFHRVGEQWSADSELFNTLLNFVRSRHQDREAAVDVDQLQLPDDFRLTLSLNEEHCSKAYEQLQSLGETQIDIRLRKAGRGSWKFWQQRKLVSLSDYQVADLRAHCQVDEDTAEDFVDRYDFSEESLATQRALIEPGVERTSTAPAGERAEADEATRLQDSEIVSSLAKAKAMEVFGVTAEDCERIANPNITDQEIRHIATTENAGMDNALFPFLVGSLLQHGRAGAGSHPGIDDLIDSLQAPDCVQVGSIFTSCGEDQTQAAATFADLVRDAIARDPELRQMLSLIAAKRIEEHREISPLGLGGSLLVSFGLGKVWEEKVTPWALYQAGITNQEPEAMRHMSPAQKALATVVLSAVQGIIEPVDSMFGLVSLRASSREEIDLKDSIGTAMVAGAISALGAMPSNAMDFLPPVAGGAAKFGAVLAGATAEMTQMLAAIAAFPLEMRQERAAQLATLVEAQRRNILAATDRAEVDRWVKEAVSNSPKTETGYAVVSIAALMVTFVYTASLFKHVMSEEGHRKLKDGLYNPAESVGVFGFNLMLSYGIPLLNAMLSVVNQVARSKMHLPDQTEKLFTAAFAARCGNAGEHGHIDSDNYRRITRNRLTETGEAIVAVLAGFGGLVSQPLRNLGVLDEAAEARIVDVAGIDPAERIAEAENDSGVDDGPGVEQRLSAA